MMPTSRTPFLLGPIDFNLCQYLIIRFQNLQLDISGAINKFVIGSSLTGIYVVVYIVCPKKQGTLYHSLPSKYFSILFAGH